MTPAARLSAAIAVLDRILAGSAAEPALTAWARASRFAGSGDRAAIRDLVFSALRRRRSAAWVGGSETGRGLILGLTRLTGGDPAALFTGLAHAPAPVALEETGRPLPEAPEAVRLDVPDWLLAPLRAALGTATESVLTAGQSRAPVWLRVNRSRATVAAAIAALAAEGIATEPHPDIAAALRVTANARRVASSKAWADGWIEVQDASSQQVTLALGDLRQVEVLDYCAGGGGKALHLADLGARVTAHDSDPRRMRDIVPRAARAGVRIARVETVGPGGAWPLVLVDAPCSGSGTWRRDPEAKWALTPERLAARTALQDKVLEQAALLTAPGGRLAYATCSLLPEESSERIPAFLARHPGWSLAASHRFLTGPLGDGFSVDILARATLG